MGALYEVNLYAVGILGPCVASGGGGGSGGKKKKIVLAKRRNNSSSETTRVECGCTQTYDALTRRLLLYVSQAWFVCDN